MRKVDPEKHELKRQEILAAAEICFARKGFRGASIAEIRAAANMSAGHLYHYFASKEEIVRELVERRLDAALAAMEQLLSQPDPFSAFLAQVSQPQPACDADGLILELLAEAGRNPAVATMIREQGARSRNLLSALIRRGQADGKVDPTLDPELAASILLVVVVDGMMALTIRQPDLIRDELAAMMGQMVRRFLSPQ
ncbi:MAG TPA: TetR/AcrR family transcriptional regulator [Caulobacter sp.]|nr:TetR/AcrR family transcriptional regulator [Caulobacter sp.]